MEEIVLGKVTPKTQTIFWDRTGISPNFEIETSSSNAESVYFSINFINTAVKWLEFTDYEGLTDGYLYKFYTFENLVGTLKNTLDLPSGTYKAKLVFTFSKAGNPVNAVIEVEVTLILSGYSPDSISTDKSVYNLAYNRSTNQLTGETHVEIINNTAGDTLTLETIGTLFKEVSFTDQLDLVEDPAFPFSTNTELPTSGVITVNCRIRKAGAFVTAFFINMTVIESEEIIVTPTRFDFLLRKGYNETKTATLKVINPLNKSFTITAPEWLTLSATSGSSSADISVTTDSSETFSVGDFTENIVVSYDATSITVPVYLSVIAFIDMNTSQYNFCLDKVILKVNKMNETARFIRIILNMNFQTADGIFTEESPYLLPYFQDIVKTDVGEKIQNYFPLFQEHLFNTEQSDFDNKMIYKAASVNITVEELDINYTVLLSKTLSNLDFFAGKKPLQFPVFTNFPLRRRYTGSRFIFSYLADLVSPSFFSGIAGPGNPAASKEVHAVMMTDEELINYNTTEMNTGIDIIAMPDQNRQHLLQWLNNNLVPEWFIFSGKYKISDDFEHLYDSFQIKGKKYNTDEMQKLTIETGFILKEEILLVKEMIKSKLAFIELEGIVYRCFPISSKLVELEAEQNLNNYELEFLIVK